jgi:hypothetical protein
MEQEPERWVDPARCPPGAPFKDPAKLLLHHVLAWLKHLRRWQTEDSPEANLFFFRQIYTSGLNDFPQCPETERTEAERNGKPVWLVTYRSYVKTAQNSKPIYYPPASWSYFYFLQSGRGPSDSSAGPDHWNGLPSRSEDETSNSNARFVPEEFKTARLWFKDCDDDVKSLTNNMMKEANNMEDKLPLWVSLFHIDSASVPLCAFSLIVLSLFFLSFMVFHSRMVCLCFLPKVLIAKRILEDPRGS